MKQTKSTVLSQWLSQRSSLASGNPATPNTIKQAIK